jgi:hypothetical protein
MQLHQVGPEQIANAAPLIRQLSNPVIQDRLDRLWDSVQGRRVDVVPDQGDWIS